MSALVFVSCDNNKYAVNFVVDDAIYSTYSTNGKKIVHLPNNPIKKGYDFEGWYWDNGVWQDDFNSNSLLEQSLTSDVSVYALFLPTNSAKETDLQLTGFNKAENKEDTYKIKVDNNKENFDFSQYVKIDIRSKWNLFSDKTAQNEIENKNVSLSIGDNIFYISVSYKNATSKIYTVQIRRREIYTVSFTTNCATEIPSQQVEEDSIVEKPSQQIQKDYYNFFKWNYDFNLPIEQDLEITAEWQAKEYTISYELNGGTNNVENPNSYTIESEDITLKNPTKEGYFFVKWLERDKIFQGSYGNIAFTAEWKVKEYSISYELNGGTNDAENPNSYTIESEDITLKVPYKEIEIEDKLYSCTFLGWSKDANLNILITKIDKGEFGNKIFYAKWGENILLGTAGLNYNMENDYYSVDGIGTVKSNEIIIPSKYNNLPVKSIGDEAFKGCESLKNITIPNSVTSINWIAFQQCKNLMNITIPSSVITIGSFAFSECEKCIIYCETINAMSDWDINWKNGNVVIWDCKNNDKDSNGYAYYYKDGITYQLKDNKVAVFNCSTDIKDEYHMLESITYKEMPYSITKINEYAFTDCQSLKNIIISNTVTSIENSAFKQCFSLISIYIPNSVINMNAYACFGCKNLIISCESISQPSGWNTNWNDSKVNVVWGVKI